MFNFALIWPDLFPASVFCFFALLVLIPSTISRLSCGQPSRSSSSHLQTSIMFSPCGKTQSLRTLSPSLLEQFFIKSVLRRFLSTVHPAANLHPTFPQSSPVIPNLPLSKLNLFSPSSPSSKLIHLAYFSLTACQCGCFCPNPVLPLSNDRSILLKSSIFFPYITLTVPLSPSTSPLACRIHSILAAEL